MGVVEQTRLSEDQITQVRAQLNRVLASSFFSGSQRCSRFLQYSVESVLSGRSQEGLKERIIGVDVFHRPADYDTAQDSTVRVTANEVRKRLGQYSAGATDEDDPTFELAAGSYAVAFRWKSAARSDWHARIPQFAGNHQLIPLADSVPNTAARLESSALRLSGQGWPWLIAIFGVLVALVTMLAVTLPGHGPKRSDVVQSVWGSLLDSQKPVTICVAQPVAYRPSSGMEKLTGPGDRMVMLPNAFVGVGDAYAVAHITALWASQGKTWYLRPSVDTSFRELTAGPVILIGSFSNPWNSKLADKLRFFFVAGPPDKIVDRTDPRGGWMVQVSPEWTTTEDYAVISRFRSPDTGETIISLAGATNFGTEAAGTFLTDPAMLSAAFRDAPKDWKSKNFQIVLHVNVQGSAPEQPTVAATYFW